MSLALVLLVFCVFLHRKNLEKQEKSEGWEPVQGHFCIINIFLCVSVSGCPSGFILEENKAGIPPSSLHL